MKLHQNIIDIICKTLDTIFINKILSDKAVPKAIQQKILGSRDRKLIASTVYDIVRWKRKYDYIIKEIELQQHHNYCLIAVSLCKRNINIINWEILSLNNDEINKIKENTNINIPNLAIKESYSDEFYSYALQSLGEDWHNIAHSLNQRANTYIHINRKKTSIDNFVAELENLDIKYKIAHNPSFIDNDDFYCIEIVEQHHLHHTQFFRQHYFYFQDLGSQCVGALMFKYIKNKTDINILDYCAGHGGKTFQLASLIKNSATIFATDFNENRLRKLKQNNHFRNIQCINFDSISSMQYDAILVDAPCSGTGTIRRQADIKYNFSIASIIEKTELQNKILVDASKLLKPNGILVYATCSILPEENEKQIYSFIKNNSNYNIVEHHTLLPSSYDNDGFYMCVLKKDL